MLPMVAIASWTLNFIVWMGVTSVVGGFVWFGRWREDENVRRRKQKKSFPSKAFYFHYCWRVNHYHDVLSCF